LVLLGAKAALDNRCRYVWKAPFRQAFLNLYAQELSRIVCVLKGKTKKCVVVDCDNTLWGGVVGEEGLEGIKLDRNTYPGKAFYDFQTSLLHLAERGVLVVLCSKNNEADVLEVLDKHPSCQLKRTHLAGWRINWEDKPANIAALAEELNLGLDSFVLVDDNPVECGLVKQLLPDVTVLQVPEKLYEFPTLLFEQGLFDTFRLTDEDRKRARLYQGESQRKQARPGFETVEEYLSSLETVAAIHRVRPGEIARVAQLTQKTNQFNVNPKRYSERDIHSFVTMPDAAVFTLSVRDRFGDLGLVGVLILECRDGVGRVDSFLMSCRALGRGLERAMIVCCLDSMGSAWGVHTWYADYVPTRKNIQVADVWPQNGFVQVSNGPNDKRTYMRDAKTAGPQIPSYVCVRED
jgi:FkbH-like protein